MFTTKFSYWNFNISFGKISTYSSEHHSREGVPTNAGLVYNKGSMLSALTKD